ncbi:MAG TPA: hypothetical protein VF407_01960 [Polyangiaceae bacterium]
MRALFWSAIFAPALVACNVGSADLPPPVSDGVACGSSHCDDACCVTDGGASCVASAASCNAGGSLVCDGPEDCGSVDICCEGASGATSGRVTYCSSATASGTCPSAGDVVVCHVDGDCPKGQTCSQSDIDGGVSFVETCH